MPKYTKIEIAIAELRRAKLCYLDADFIGALVLTGAARSILLNLCEHYGIKSTANIIGSDTGFSVRDINDLISLSYNASKHADRDPTDEIDISSGRVKALFAIAASDLHLLNKFHDCNVDDIFSFAVSLREIV